MRDDVLELLRALGHQRMADVQRLRVADVEEVPRDQNVVVHLALEFHLLLVREDVVHQARGVGRRVLQGPDGPGGVDLVGDAPARLAQPAQVHREVRAEGVAAHLGVVHRVRDAALDLVLHLPDPALQHAHQGRPELGADGRGHAPAGAHPQIGERALHRGDRQGLFGVVDRDHRDQPRGGRLGGREVLGLGEDHRVVVVPIRPPGQPARVEEQRLGRGVGVDAGRAEREVVAAQLRFVPDGGTGVAGLRVQQAHAPGPVDGSLAGVVQMRAQGERERHVDVRDHGRPGALEGHVGEGAAAQVGGALREHGPQVERCRAEPGREEGQGERGGGPGLLVHVAAGDHVPLVAAGLPVLQAFDIGEDGPDLRRVHRVVGEQLGELGQRGLLELVEAGGEQIVGDLGGLLGGASEEGLQHKYGVGEFTLVGDLALVGEEVVADVDGVGEGVAQDAERARVRDARRDFGGDVLDQAGRPGGAAHLAAHLDVFEGVRHAPDADVGELPHRLVEEVLRRQGEPFPPVRGHRGHGPRPEVGEARLDRVGGHGKAVGQVHRHERGEPVEVPPGTVTVLRALEHLQEVVVEEEHPHVPVGDQRQRVAVAVGVRVGAEQRVVVRVEIPLLPDAGTFQHPEAARPSPGVDPRVLQVGIQSRRIRHIEIRQLKRLRHGGVGPSSMGAGAGLFPGPLHEISSALPVVPVG